MIPEEYERRRQRLEEERRAAHDLVEAGYCLHLQALERLRNGDSGQAAPPLPPPAWAPAPQPPVLPPRRRKAGELFYEIQDALDKVPEVFDRNHICQVIGYEPDRGSLHRALNELLAEGFLVHDTPSNGRIPAKYRKKEAPSPQSDG